MHLSRIYQVSLQLVKLAQYDSSGDRINVNERGFEIVFEYIAEQSVSRWKNSNTTSPFQYPDGLTCFCEPAEPFLVAAATIDHGIFAALYERPVRQPLNVHM